MFGSGTVLPAAVVVLVVLAVAVGAYRLLARGDLLPHGVASTGAGPSATATAPGPSGTATATPSPTVDRSVPVLVLNATRSAGLAGAKQAVLRAKGWTVPAIGNFSGDGPAVTTVYFAGADQAGQAAALVADLGVGQARLAPVVVRDQAVAHGEPQVTLVVALARDAAS